MEVGVARAPERGVGGGARGDAMVALVDGDPPTTSCGGAPDMDLIDGCDADASGVGGGATNDAAGVEGEGTACGEDASGAVSMFSLLARLLRLCDNSFISCEEREICPLTAAAARASGGGRALEEELALFTSCEERAICALTEAASRGTSTELPPLDEPPTERAERSEELACAGGTEASGCAAVVL